MTQINPYKLYVLLPRSGGTAPSTTDAARHDKQIGSLVSVVDAHPAHPQVKVAGIDGIEFWVRSCELELAP